MGRLDAGGVLLRGQGEPLHDPRLPPQGAKEGRHRPLLREARAAAGSRQTRSDPLAASRELQARRRAAGASPRASARRAARVRVPSRELVRGGRLSLLREYGAALVVSDHPKWPFQTRKLTTDWTYVRLHYGRRGRGGTTRRARSRPGTKNRRLASTRSRSTPISTTTGRRTPCATRPRSFAASASAERSRSSARPSAPCTARPIRAPAQAVYGNSGGSAGTSTRVSRA